MLQRVWMNHVQVLRGRVRRDLKIVKRHGKLWASNANCCNSVARLLFWWSVSRGYNDATSAFEQLEELLYVVSSVCASLLDTDKSAVARITRLVGAKSQLERCFVHISGEYASGNEWFLVWQEIDAVFESILIDVMTDVINFNHIEPRRFLEDAGNALERDAIERHDSKSEYCVQWRIFDEG